ncbi:uncharacterized protein LOC117789702 [Drosophila innubila]|uniref:uncharacterized protein LOC117789702 n=1 Tax=Drosophila innubila TaxID=198719 RepID=UPI00148C6FAE|nr:uncharacterized protein LOC117789702 [Drosophila innubila]
MKTFCLLLLFALLAIVYAAPAPAPAGNDPTVSVLRYSSDQDLAKIQQLIIAQYEAAYKGPSQIHETRVANAVNPHYLNINV